MNKCCTRPHANVGQSLCSYFFFFSSRRRHTRYWRDWSSDVCSSDLTCGDRRTVHRSVFVGSGIGPDTCAPVFSAVRTMSADAWSITAWSKALRRIRILPAMVALSDEFRGPRFEFRESLTRNSNRETLHLLQNLRDDARAHRPPALADGEAHLLLHRDRRDELDRHGDVVARHDHLRPLRQLDRPGDVGRAEVELRAVALEERGVPAALVFRQEIGRA